MPRSAKKAPLPSDLSRAKTNHEIAELLLAMAQALTAKGDNPFKAKAYRRAAETIKSLSESIDEAVHQKSDLTHYPGIGKTIAGVIAEIVSQGAPQQLELLHAELAPEVAALSQYPKLDPKRVLEAYKKLKISTTVALQEKLDDGTVAQKLGERTAQHFRSAFNASQAILLVEADELVSGLISFIKQCGARRVEAVGDYRRRVETISELYFLVNRDNFLKVVEKFQQHGGRADLVNTHSNSATFRLSSGMMATLQCSEDSKWGLSLVETTGSPAHLEQLDPTEENIPRLENSKKGFPTEHSVYKELGFAYIEPELREGWDALQKASAKKKTPLVTIADVQGELHAHTTSSDGAHTIEEMAAAAKERGYSYLGITDHSQSLRIAGGVSEEALWKQIREIDRLNSKLRDFRLLKSAEVDILADGTLDYPNELLRELDYTVCSIHSRFRLNKAQQTERLLRAMDNPYFSILGHATGRLLLRRPGYEIDIERLVKHAKERGCFFEINASPDRLDLSAAHARLAREAGVKIAICTDAHSTAELTNLRCGVEQARRAGLNKSQVLNCYSWKDLEKIFSGRRS